MAEGPFEVLATAIRALDALGIPHMLGGSMASSIHGIARFTDDADVVIDLHFEQVESLARALETSFYVSREAMQEAVRRRSSFNAIHLDSVIKLDFFVLGQDAYDREQFGRRTPADMGESDAPPLMLSSAEDMILRKLQWFRAGGESSERQWRDVLGILQVRRGTLAAAYLKQWSAHLGVSDLLEQAVRDAEREDADGA